MKKRISLIALALLCALSLCFAAIPAFAEGDLGDLSGESESLPAGGEESESAGAPAVDVDLVDVALNAPVTGTLCLFNNPDWDPNYLTLGLKSTGRSGETPCGWHYQNTDGSVPISLTNAPVITITLDRVSTIHRIDLYPSACYSAAWVSTMPQDFTIELSSDGGLTWETVWVAVGVVSKTEGVPGHDYSDGLPAVNMPLSHELDEPTEANMFRMTITKGGAGQSGRDDYDRTYAPFVAFNSIELMGVLGEGPEIETETETKAPALVNPNTGNNNNNYDDEDETEPETEAETEAETVAETVAETEAPKAETKAPETAAPAADDTADAGCASVVGLGAVAVLTAAAAAVVLKKKD